MDAGDRSGVLVMSIWAEKREEGASAFRARITWTIGVAEPQRGEAVTASVEDALAYVRAWIDQVRATETR